MHTKYYRICADYGSNFHVFNESGKPEPVIAWLQQFRRIVVRWEFHATSFLGFVQLGCIIILLRSF